MKMLLHDTAIIQHVYIRNISNPISQKLREVMKWLCKFHFRQDQFYLQCKHCQRGPA